MVTKRAARLGVAAACASTLALASAIAHADPRCGMSNVTPMDFGVYQVGTTMPLDSIGQLTVECDSPTPFRVLMGRGLSGRQIPRAMKARGVELAYNLFLDAARTVVWGDGTEGTQVFLGVTPAGGTVQIPIFGRIFPMQAVPRGSYTDRIVVFAVF